MKKRILIAAVLSLATTAVLADMYQDAKNAELPAARQNLELGTVKSEGAAPPNAAASTKFYGYTNVPGDNINYSYDKIQFQVQTDPDATDWAIEQAGKTGAGATRVCQTSVGTTADCNYISRGWASRHFFGNGAGGVAEFSFRNTGYVPPAGPETGYSRAWVKLVARDDATAQISAAGTANVGLELRPKGVGTVNVGLKDNDAPVSGTGQLTFIASNTTAQPSQIKSDGHGVRIVGERITTHRAHGAYTVPIGEAGTHYHNTWLSGDGTPAFTTLTLPAALVQAVPVGQAGTGGGNFCFAVDEPQLFTVQAAPGDKIAIGATNSIAGGKITSNQPFASICLEVHKDGQWFAVSTPDKTQWTVL